MGWLLRDGDAAAGHVTFCIAQSNLGMVGGEVPTAGGLPRGRATSSPLPPARGGSASNGHGGCVCPSSHRSPGWGGFGVQDPAWGSSGLVVGSTWVNLCPGRRRLGAAMPHRPAATAGCCMAPGLGGDGEMGTHQWGFSAAEGSWLAAAFGVLRALRCSPSSEGAEKG